MFLQKNSEIINPFMFCGNKRSYILKSSKSTKSEVFLKEFFNKFEVITKFEVIILG